MQSRHKREVHGLGREDQTRAGEIVDLHPGKACRQSTRGIGIFDRARDRTSETEIGDSHIGKRERHARQLEVERQIASAEAARRDRSAVTIGKLRRGEDPAATLLGRQDSAPGHADRAAGKFALRGDCDPLGTETRIEVERKAHSTLAGNTRIDTADAILHLALRRQPGDEDIAVLHALRIRRAAEIRRSCADQAFGINVRASDSNRGVAAETCIAGRDIDIDELLLTARS